MIFLGEPQRPQFRARCRRFVGLRTRGIEGTEVARLSLAIARRPDDQACASVPRGEHAYVAAHRIESAYATVCDGALAIVASGAAVACRGKRHQQPPDPQAHLEYCAPRQGSCEAGKLPYDAAGQALGVRLERPRVG